MFQSKARARFVRGSARKMRQVIDLVRGKPVNEALNMLSMLPKSAAQPVRKTVQSAAANALAAEGTAHLKAEDLRIALISVDGGPSMKRIRPMGMGRAYRISKPLCHLTVVLEGEASAAESGGARSRRAASGAKTSGTKPARRTDAKKSSGAGKKSQPAGGKSKSAPSRARKDSK